ncbi:MAG: DUF4395 domain-containing protein [Acidimicrobiales bacterium]
MNPDLVSLVYVSQLFVFPNPVNEISARLVAGGVVVMGLACLVLRQPWLMVVLALGFLLRVAAGPRFDPLGLLVTRVITPRLPLAERLTPGPPKRFAQAIGAAFTVSASLLYYGFGLSGLAYGLIAVLVVFATLESVLGFCMGCKVFGLLMKAGFIPDSVCEECNDLSLRWARLGASAD